MKTFFFGDHLKNLAKTARPFLFIGLALQLLSFFDLFDCPGFPSEKYGKIIIYLKIVLVYT